MYAVTQNKYPVTSELYSTIKEVENNVLPRLKNNGTGKIKIEKCNIECCKFQICTGFKGMPAVSLIFHKNDKLSKTEEEWIEYGKMWAEKKNVKHFGYLGIKMHKDNKHVEIFFMSPET